MDPNEQEATETPDVQQVEDDGGVDLAALLFDEDANKTPKRIAELDPVLEHAGRKSWKITQEELDALPDPALKLAHNLRGAFLNKTRELAEVRKTVAAEKAELERERLALQQDRAAIRRSILDPKVVGLFKPPDGEAPDPFTEEGVEYRVNKLLAARMDAFFGHFKETADVGDAELAEQIERVERERDKAELKEWIAAEPGRDSWVQEHSDVWQKLKEAGMPWREVRDRLLKMNPPRKPEAPDDPDAERRERRAAAQQIAPGGAAPKPTSVKSVSY